MIAPGFVDLQVNGAFGADVGVDPGALEAISRALPRTGVTAYLPTAISWPLDRYAGLFDAVERAAGAPGARILGVHLEGPFLAPTRSGAHDPANVRPVDLGALRELLGSGQVRVMTLAPELPGALDAIELITGSGSGGQRRPHRGDARRDRARGGRRPLARYPPLQRHEPARAPASRALPGALLADGRLRTGLIADGGPRPPGRRADRLRRRAPAGSRSSPTPCRRRACRTGLYELSGRRRHRRARRGAARGRDARRRRGDHGQGGPAPRRVPRHRPRGRDPDGDAHPGARARPRLARPGSRPAPRPTSSCTPRTGSSRRRGWRGSRCTGGRGHDPSSSTSPSRGRLSDRG